LAAIRQSPYVVGTAPSIIADPYDRVWKSPRSGLWDDPKYRLIGYGLLPDLLVRFGIVAADAADDYPIQQCLSVAVWPPITAV
jgi:hypothetical protein